MITCKAQKEEILILSVSTTGKFTEKDTASCSLLWSEDQKTTVNNIQAAVTNLLSYLAKEGLIVIVDKIEPELAKTESVIESVGSAMLA